MRTAAEEALKLSEERYALALEGAKDGIWDWDLVNDVIFLSPRCKSMLGLPPGSIGLMAETTKVIGRFNLSDGGPGGSGRFVLNSAFPAEVYTASPLRCTTNRSPWGLSGPQPMHVVVCEGSRSGGNRLSGTVTLQYDRFRCATVSTTLLDCRDSIA